MFNEVKALLATWEWKLLQPLWLHNKGNCMIQKGWSSILKHGTFYSVLESYFKYKYIANFFFKWANSCFFKILSGNACGGGMVCDNVIVVIIMGPEPYAHLKFRRQERLTAETMFFVFSLEHNRSYKSWDQKFKFKPLCRARNVI